MDKGVEIRYNGRGSKLFVSKDLWKLYISIINQGGLLSHPNQQVW